MSSFRRENYVYSGFRLPPLLLSTRPRGRCDWRWCSPYIFASRGILIALSSRVLVKCSGRSRLNWSGRRPCQMVAKESKSLFHLKIYLSALRLTWAIWCGEPFRNVQHDYIFLRPKLNQHNRDFVEQVLACVERVVYALVPWLPALCAVDDYSFTKKYVMFKHLLFQMLWHWHKKSLVDEFLFEFGVCCNHRFVVRVALQPLLLLGFAAAYFGESLGVSLSKR